MDPEDEHEKAGEPGEQTSYCCVSAIRPSGASTDPCCHVGSGRLPGAAPSTPQHRVNKQLLLTVKAPVWWREKGRLWLHGRFHFHQVFTGCWGFTEADWGGERNTQEQSKSFSSWFSCEVHKQPRPLWLCCLPPASRPRSTQSWCTGCRGQPGELCLR